jgi:two-component system OmpR family response regulator
MPPIKDEVDFTRPGALTAPEPSPAEVENARLEAEVGCPQLQGNGFYVAIARRSPVRNPPRNARQFVVLVVEDDGDLGQLLIDVLMNAGFEVRWASNRSEINAELRRGAEIDFVLLDIVLPDADGLQVLRRLREHPEFTKLPVIMMTGKAAAGDVLAGLVAGADGYVTKPFKVSGLMTAVSLVLGRS